MNYYRRYSGDYLRDTSRLSLIDHGVYTVMLDYYYAEEAPLPLDHDEVCRMIRALKPDERKAVDKILARYFVRCDDGYHNNRADEEMGKAIPLIEAARENGKKGGRRKNPPDNPTGSGGDNPTGNGDGTQREPDGLPNGQHPPTSNLQPPYASPQPPPTNRQEKAAEARASRLPADFEMPQAWIGWAMGERPTWTLDHALRVARAFRNHWIAKAGKDGRKLDWYATWQNWVFKEKPMQVYAGRESVEAKNRAAAEEWLAGSSPGEREVKPA